MNTTTPTFAGKTAEEWREQARQHTRSAADSRDRCDTDGFLSQWASDRMAATYLHNADVAENGGIIEIPALFHDGELVTDGRHVQGRYGFVWVHDDADGAPVWLSESKAQTATKRRAYFTRKHVGYTLGWVRVEAGLNRRTGEAFPKRDAIVEIVTADDTDDSAGHNNVY